MKVAREDGASNGMGCGTLLFLFVAFAIVVSIFKGGGDDKKPTARETDQDAPASVVSTPAPKTTKGRITRAVKALDLGDGVRGVTVAGPRENRDVTVRFTQADNLTRGLRRGGVERDMAEVYETIYTSRDAGNVATVTVASIAPLIDALGNESDGRTFQTTMTGEIGRSINWKNASTLNFNRLWSIDFKLDDF